MREWFRHLPNEAKRELCDHAEKCLMRSDCKFFKRQYHNYSSYAYCSYWEDIDDFKLMVCHNKYGQVAKDE
jgi:hypothetical protein